MVALSAPDKLLTERWYPLRHHPGQWGYWNSTADFDVLSCTRRGGKSELFKRDGVRDTLEHHQKQTSPGVYVYTCPTRDQVNQIYWEDLKQLSPDWFVRKISESKLSIEYINGARIQLSGMDKPARIEGQRLVRVFCDEFHAWKTGAFEQTIQPALGTIGVHARCAIAGIERVSPDFKKLCDIARAGTPGWRFHSWTAEGLLDEGYLANAKRTMDPRMFAQEFMARRVEFQGLVYYCFDRSVHGRERVAHGYNKRAPLEISLDFNVEPGTASISQRMLFRDRLEGIHNRAALREDRPEVADEIDAFIGEVWIPASSDTHRVCRKIIADWGGHEGFVYVYGDPAGGQRKSSADQDQTDWSIVEKMLGDHFGHDRVILCVDSADPGVRARVNAMNARLMTADGIVHTLIDPEACPNLLDDFEQTLVLPGSDGEIWKKKDLKRSHLTDGTAYRASNLETKSVSDSQELF